SGDPFRSIQAGINFSSDDDSVTVAAGTYVENINFRGRNIKVAGEDRETTIIDGDSLNSVVRFTASDQSYTATLKNFTIKNGFGIPYEDSGWYGGSGVYVENEGEFLTTAIIEKCIIRDNTLPLSGKGIGIFFNFGSTGIIKDCIFTNNKDGHEGVIYSWGGYQLKNSVFYDNYNGSVIYHCANFEDPIIINNCVFYNNHPGGNGNDALIHTQGPSQLQVTNSIIWDNDQDSLWFDQDNTPDAAVTISYSDVQFENQDGVGIINVDPLFVDPDNDDFNLTADSRLIDAGHPDSTDVDGTIADMGAYYYDQAGQPVRVSNLITTPAADNVSVKWNANSAAASYNIYRSIDGSADFYSLSPYTTESDTSYV
ncbi:MAG: right-handed parallel beta-helix repeat-containing protein, partial [Candidatus Neomarinimicrobiota bacterium]|nr:right-handed parallel beta-helix repeat-containing protein [Candidatus Neomarinimicrobiota bacterium]